MGAPGRPTLLCYGHYDVQPPDPLDEWESPPFEPTVRGDNLYARGASDDKGQLMIQICAVESWLRTAGRLPVNVKFFIEGEEELGSPRVTGFIPKNKRLLRADVSLVCDGSFFASEVPALVTGLRGLVYTEVEARGAALGPPHPGGTRDRRRLHGAGPEDGHPGPGDGEDQHAAGAGSEAEGRAPGLHAEGGETHTRRRADRGARALPGGSGGRGPGGTRDAHGRPGDRGGLREATGLHARGGERAGGGGIHPRPARARRAHGLRAAGRPAARAQREVPPAQLLPRDRHGHPLRGTAGGTGTAGLRSPAVWTR